jgi:hypothetical protein
VQSKADTGESEDGDSGNVVKQHRGDQSSRGAALRVTSRQPTGYTQASNPAPPTRATVKAGAASNGAPTRSATVADGKHSRAKPAPSSITAVRVYRAFMDEELLNCWCEKAWMTSSG